MEGVSYGTTVIVSCGKAIPNGRIVAIGYFTVTLGSGVTTRELVGS